MSATGFDLSVLGDIAFTVDGEAVEFPERVTWRGVMISGIPDMAYVFGYFRKLDAAGGPGLRPGDPADGDHAAQGRDHGRARAARRGRRHAAAPVLGPRELQRRLRHALQHLLPRQGDREPWTHMLEHAAEAEILPKADLDDGSLVYR